MSLIGTLRKFRDIDNKKEEAAIRIADEYGGRYEVAVPLLLITAEQIENEGTKSFTPWESRLWKIWNLIRF